MAKGPKSVETLVHDEATRRNIPTAELQSTAEYLEEMHPAKPAHYPRARPLAEGQRRERAQDLDPQIVWNGARIRLTKAQLEQLHETGEVEIGDAQLVWRGKDTQDWSDLIVQTPPLYIQEKIHPKAIIDDLKRRSGKAESTELDLFADFNGIDPEAKTEFYQHDQHWSNRMILGDSLQVMASLAEREALAGKVQCIYFDPPYGIKFNSNWQVSTLSRDVKDGKQTDISREPEQVKAFRDTWKDGIHSYLTYLRDRLTVMRELLTESGSIFVQISDENVHRVRAVLDEVFGENNFCGEIVFTKATGLSSKLVPSVFDYILWYARSGPQVKYRPLYERRLLSEEADGEFRLYRDEKLSTITPVGERKKQLLEEADSGFFRTNSAISPGVRANTTGSFDFQGLRFHSGSDRNWKTTMAGMVRLAKADRLILNPKSVRIYKQFWSDFPYFPLTNIWRDVRSQQDRIYVVQTVERVIQRCMLLTTDPGDLVLDPTCGSGTTAHVAEQWGRRWITIDTSRVALALARTRLMSARFPYYYLADSSDGRLKEQQISGKSQPLTSTAQDIRHGFVYERAPHVTLKSIANNTEIDVIWEQWQVKLEPLRERLNALLGKAWEEWEIPRDVVPSWPEQAKVVHRDFWNARIARQKEIDVSIARRADVALYRRELVTSPGGPVGRGRLG